MARPIRPVPGSAKKVFIQRGGRPGAAVTFSSSPHAEAVQVVNDPRLADESVAVYAGPNRVDRATAKKLQRASLKEQERLAAGKKDKGVFDQIVADLEQPATPQREKTGRSGISFRSALVAAAIGWLGVCVYFLTHEGIGPAFASLLATVIVAPSFAFTLKLFDFFVPEVTWLAALGIVVIGWGAGLGLIDFDRKGSGSEDRAGKEVPVGSSPEPQVPGESEVSDVTVAPRAGDWPSGKEAYTIIIASKETEAEAVDIAEKAAGKGLNSGVIRSDSYTTLLPGFWVAYAEDFSSFDSAEKRLEWFHTHGFADAFAELISEEPQPPAGPITATTVGSIRIGMATSDVDRYLIAPDERNEFGFSSGPPVQLDWIWHLSDGDLTLQFEAETELLANYQTDSAEFFTTSGASVGDSFKPIEQEYSDQLRESPIGEHTMVLSEGRPGSFPALTFSVYDTLIQSVSGGEGPPAGE